MSFRIWVRDNLFTPAKRLSARAEVRRYLARHPARRLNIGAGGNRLRGWLNVDRFPPPGVTFMDATERLPCRDATFETILCEHMIEHVAKADALHLLREMKRLLVPGGRVRVVTPDLDWFSRRILEPVPAGAQDDAYRAFLDERNGRRDTSWCDAMNLCFYEHGHRYIWSIEELEAAMREAGFSDRVVTRAGEVRDPAFADAEGHPRLIGHLVNSLEAFAIEARA